MFFNKKITAIVAYIVPSGAMGNNNTLLLKCREDMEHFRLTTLSSRNKKNVVIMGRKTFESMRNRPLSNRINIVFSSRDVAFTEGDLILVKSMAEFENVMQKIRNDIGDIYVIGGECIYNLFLRKGYIDRIIATEFYVNNFVDADTYFNLNELTKFMLISSKQLTDYAYVKTYRKKLTFRYDEQDIMQDADNSQNVSKSEIFEQRNIRVTS